MSAYRRLFVVAAAVLAPAAFAAAPKPDIENGKNTFTAQCGICHSVDKAVNKELAPTLVGIVGRKAAMNKDYPGYTTALKNSKITWNVKTLDEFLSNPMVKVPGTTMPMLIADPQVRADVIGYLATVK